MPTMSNRVTPQTVARYGRSNGRNTAGQNVPWAGGTNSYGLAMMMFCIDPPDADRIMANQFARVESNPRSPEDNVARLRSGVAAASGLHYDRAVRDHLGFRPTRSSRPAVALTPPTNRNQFDDERQPVAWCGRVGKAPTPRTLINRCTPPRRLSAKPSHPQVDPTTSFSTCRSPRSRCGNWSWA